MILFEPLHKLVMLRVLGHDSTILICYRTCKAALFIHIPRHGLSQRVCQVAISNQRRGKSINLRSCPLPVSLAITPTSSHLFHPSQSRLSSLADRVLRLGLIPIHLFTHRPRGVKQLFRRLLLSLSQAFAPFFKPRVRVNSLKTNVETKAWLSRHIPKSESSPLFYFSVTLNVKLSVLLTPNYNPVQTSEGLFGTVEMPRSHTAGYMIFPWGLNYTIQSVGSLGHPWSNTKKSRLIPSPPTLRLGFLLDILPTPIATVGRYMPTILPARARLPSRFEMTSTAHTFNSCCRDRCYAILDPA